MEISLGGGSFSLWFLVQSQPTERTPLEASRFAQHFHVLSNPQAWSGPCWARNPSKGY